VTPIENLASPTINYTDTSLRARSTKLSIRLNPMNMTVHYNLSILYRRIEPQNALDAHVLGTFRDLDDPDRFVWLRGFRDIPARGKALEAFYGGPVWQAHKNDANATTVDSDNVLLLRPASPGWGISEQAARGTAG
jgi:hypothetical protein